MLILDLSEEGCSHLANAHGETDATSIIGGRCAEYSGKTPSDIGYQPVVTGGRAASGAYWRISPGGSAIVGIFESGDETCCSWSTRQRSNLEVDVM